VRRSPSRIRRGRALMALALMGSLLVALIVGLIVAHRGGSVRVVRRSQATGVGGRSVPRGSFARLRARIRDSRQAVSSRTDPSRVRLQAALDQGVRRAGELGGVAGAAVWVDGDPRPLLSGSVSVPRRMWSMSKAVVSVAALQAVHDRPDPVLRSALEDAVRRSDNCAIRRVIVGLQEHLNEGVSGTVAAFDAVLGDAGARIETAPQAAAAEDACVGYLDRHRGGMSGSDLGIAPQFGTAQWSVLDAIAFTHALSEGAYGASGAYLLDLMTMPKEGPLEEPAPPSAPALDWGAGAAFPSAWRPAWKAGWGGSRLRPARFLAGQIVVLRPPNAGIAVAALFLPGMQPADDNPGITTAPQALERIFAAVRFGLQTEHPAGEPEANRDR
jgi:hypothetical protein